MTDGIERTVSIPKWEYLSVALIRGDAQEVALRGFGTEGWELVALNWDTGEAVFKRVTGLMELRVG